MTFYLFQGRYTAAAMKAMVEKPQDREASARVLIEAAGGKLHHLFFAFGSEDIVALIESEDEIATMAALFAIGASGAMSAGATTRLITAQDAMKAMGAAKALTSVYKPATA